MTSSSPWELKVKHSILIHQWADHLMNQLVLLLLQCLPKELTVLFLENNGVNYFNSKMSSWLHTSRQPLSFSSDQSHGTVGLWNTSVTWCVRRPHLFFSLCRSISRFKCDRGELWGVCTLSFAAVSNVCSCVPKLHRALTKCHQVMTVVVCLVF